MCMNIFNLFCKTPFYPYWLDILEEERKNDDMLMKLSGKVLETGAGNCKKKDRALQINKKIKKYTATDYDSWDELFQQQTTQIKKFGKLTEAMYGPAKDAKKLDAICDAMNLPFKDSSFDSYCSFEVLEHIKEPLKFYKEASRVLKKGGICITVAPFLYRQHGDIDEDFQRLAKGGYHLLAKKTGFEVLEISSQNCFGSTFASLINQYTIRKIVEGNIVVKLVVLIVSPLIFFTTNCIGFVLDTIDHDERFAERYHVVMKKK